MNSTPSISLLAARCVAAGRGVAPLTAQSAATSIGATGGGGDETVRLEAFTVTGSNLRRIEVERVLPVTVLDAGAIEVRDGSQPSDLLTAMPQITGLPGNETATLGSTARGDNATV
ncbi:MAG: hypothetical protein FJ399_05250 [Verrucomicrobia bacterium]|nr:hypothetical protein [Verrucomicrobiota bacterium]